MPLIVLGLPASPAAASPGGCPPSDHDCSEVGGPGCLDVACCEKVCAFDPFCCAAAWDLACVDQAAAFCRASASCDGVAADCLQPHGTPGCGDPACLNHVCTLDSSCCLDGWDSDCVALAVQLCCPPPGCGGPGSCFETHLGPGCDDIECCATVCSVDLSCCQAQWTTDCAELAGELCAGPKLDNPLEILISYRLNSGVHDNASDTAAVVFTHTVVLPDRPWMRPYFAEMNLGPGSAVRATSLIDGATQTLNAAHMAMWDNTMAYFNGDMLMIELIAGPGTSDNSFVLGTMGTLVDSHTCAIRQCNPSPPARYHSNHDWAGRHFPAGCSSVVIDALGTALTAGHCSTFRGNSVIFRVPPSADDCSPQVPDPEHQFPVIFSVGTGPYPAWAGKDWRVLRLGPNYKDETHFEKYGTFRSLSPFLVPVNTPVSTVGFGKANPPEDYAVQQQSDGLVITGLQTVQSQGGGIGMYYWYSGGTVTSGNSGGAVLHDDRVVGIMSGCGGIQRLDQPDFAAARADVFAKTTCIPPIPDVSHWWPFDVWDVAAGTPELLCGHDAAAGVQTGHTNPHGQLGRALDFFQATGGLLAPLTSGCPMSFGPGGGTVAAWVKVDAPGAGSQMILDFDPFTGIDRYSLWIDPAGPDYKLRFSAIWTSGGTGFNVQSSGTFIPDDWTHVAVTVSPASIGFPFNRTVNFYINGGIAGTSVHPGVQIIGQGALAHIGGNGSFGKLLGQLDDLRVYRRDLTPGEIGMLAGSGGTCTMSCSTLWDVPFCDGDTSVASYVTVFNAAPYSQNFHLSFTPLPLGVFPAGTIDGPTDISVNSPNPFPLGPGQTQLIPITIQRPVGMTAPWQFGTFEVTLTNLTGGQVATCLGSAQDRSDWCASLPDIDPPFLIVDDAGSPIDITALFTNTSGADLLNQVVIVKAFGEDMKPTDAIAFNGLAPGKPLVTSVSMASGATISFDFSVSAPSFVAGLFSIVLFSDVNNDGELEALTSLTATIEPPDSCPVDLTDDGVVDGADLGIMLGSWGAGGPADLDGNGVVDGGDLGLLLGAWGPCP